MEIMKQMKVYHVSDIMTKFILSFIFYIQNPSAELF